MEIKVICAESTLRNHCAIKMGNVGVFLESWKQLDACLSQGNCWPALKIGQWEAPFSAPSPGAPQLWLQPCLPCLFSFQLHPPPDPPAALVCLVLSLGPNHALEMKKASGPGPGLVENLGPSFVCDIKVQNQSVGCHYSFQARCRPCLWASGSCPDVYIKAIWPGLEGGAHRALASSGLHTASGLIPWTLIGVTQEPQARSNHWTLLGVAQKENKLYG